MESHAKRLIQSIVLNVFFLSCFSLLRGELSYGEIRTLACDELATDLPGLALLMYKTDAQNLFLGDIDAGSVRGSSFELESALYMKAHGQPIIGFDLDISFDFGKVVFPYKGKEININATEFDVVTSRFLLEVKSGANPDKIKRPHEDDEPSDSGTESISGVDEMAVPITHYTPVLLKKQMMQFRKERLVIEWMGALKKDIDAGVLHIDVRFGTNRPLITICGPSTGNTHITFTSSWICGPSEMECINQFLYVVNCLADKIFFVFFKHAAPQLVALLKQEGFVAKDNVSLDEFVVKGSQGLCLAQAG